MDTQISQRSNVSSPVLQPIAICTIFGTLFRASRTTVSAAANLLPLPILLLLIGTSFGCSFFTSPASEEKLNPNQAYWFHYEAARRGGFLVGTDSAGKSNVKMCSEPAPDVALARTADFIAKGTYQGASVEAQAKLAEQLAQLGGRTETVLILRESLFRLCELSINSSISLPDIQGLYKTVVEAVVKLAETDSTNAQAAAKKATAEVQRAETEHMRTFNTLTHEDKLRFAPR